MAAVYPAGPLPIMTRFWTPKSSSVLASSSLATEAASAPETGLRDDERVGLLLLVVKCRGSSVADGADAALPPPPLLLLRDGVPEVCRHAVVVDVVLAADGKNVGTTKASQERWLRWMVATVMTAVAETTSKRLQLPIFAFWVCDMTCGVLLVVRLGFDTIARQFGTWDIGSVMLRIT